VVADDVLLAVRRLIARIRTPITDLTDLLASRRLAIVDHSIARVG
jgi:hypothetical protein